MDEAGRHLNRSLRTLNCKKKTGSGAQQSWFGQSSSKYVGVTFLKRNVQFRRRNSERIRMRIRYIHHRLQTIITKNIHSGFELC